MELIGVNQLRGSGVAIRNWSIGLKNRVKSQLLKYRSLRLQKYTLMVSLTLLVVLFQNCDPAGVPNGSTPNGDGFVDNASGNGNGSGDNPPGGGSTPPPGGGTPPPGGGTPPPVVTGNPAPPNPTGIALTANTVNSISLTWTAGGGSTVAYRVAYQEGTTAPASCGSGTVLSVNSTVGLAANLTRAKQYSFRVCAVNGNTTPDMSSGITYTTGTRCFQNPAPTIVQDTFASFSFPMGMGPLSGTATNIPQVAVTGTNAGGPYDLNQTYSLRCTTSVNNVIDVDCEDNNGTNFNNNAASIRFQQPANSQCQPTGPVTVTMVARDECGAESPAKTIVVNVTNECLPEAKIVAVEKSQNDQFGSQVAIDGDYAVVVETGDSEGGDGAGAANVFFYNGTSWIFQQKLIPTEAAMSDNMKSVAISGSRIVLGSPYHPTAGVGAVFVFDRSGSTWTQTAKITPSQPNVQDVGDLFGYSVALSGNQLVVGAPWDNNVETAGSKLAYAGAAYVYNLSGGVWVQDGSKVVVSGNTGRNEFGASVAIGTNYIVVGAPHNETFKGNGNGKAYVLRKPATNWTVSQTLESSNKKAGDMFGISVKTDGTRIAVGAIFGTGRAGQTSSGAAYIFENTGSWVQTASIGASDVANGDRFGASIALAGDDLLVGSHWDDSKTGAVYHYRRSGTSWTQSFKIMSRDRAINDEFGGSVSLSNRRAICGSRLDDGAAENIGAAYIVNLK